MENKEQLNQNSELNEGIENEKVTPKSVKKAIDGNEKKKIMKLIQPDILPGKVRIEVCTLVEGEMPAKPSALEEEKMPEMPEVMPEIEGAVDAEDEEDVVEDSNDLVGLNKLQLVELLEETVQDSDVLKIKDKVAAIRLHFNQLNKVDMDNELDKFLEGGGLQEEFQHAEDPLEQRFNAAFGIFKANRAKQNEDIEKQKVENLAQKQALLEELKQIIASDESLKKTYDDFRALQDRWKEIGQVPATENANLWNNYHFLVEQFFDKVRIGRELRDLDMKKNLDAKIDLCEKAEELLNEKSMTKSFKALQKLHEDWKEIGPVPQDKKEEIWERFKAASDKINQIRREHYSKLQEEQNTNLEAKKALCEKAEEIIGEDYTSVNAWQKKSTDFAEIFKMWKAIGPAAKKDNEEIWNRFKTAMDTFFAKKKEFFASMKDRQTENLDRKTQLCLEAEALMESTDWRNATEQLKKLQEEWKTIGPVPKRHTDKIWKRFRTACDTFFNRKNEHFSGRRSEEEANLAAKKALLEAIMAFQIGPNRNENMDAIKSFQKQWIEIGYVPMKQKEAINKEYRKLIDDLFDQMRKNQHEISTNEYREMMEGLKDNPEGYDKVRKERLSLQNRIQKLRDEIAVLENNIGFFSNSKNSELMKAEYEKKINKAKEDLKLLEDKLKIAED
jgi:polyhydroxyalkanoate synthesis regulator phasin